MHANVPSFVDAVSERGVISLDSITPRKSAQDIQLDLLSHHSKFDPIHLKVCEKMNSAGFDS